MATESGCNGVRRNDQCSAMTIVPWHDFPMTGCSLTSPPCSCARMAILPTCGRRPMLTARRRPMRQPPPLPSLITYRGLESLSTLARRAVLNNRIWAASAAHRRHTGLALTMRWLVHVFARLAIAASFTNSAVRNGCECRANLGRCVTIDLKSPNCPAVLAAQASSWAITGAIKPKTDPTRGELIDMNAPWRQ
jgi:hypothetical protein